MDIAMIGLGKMGGQMARRLLAGGHRVVGLDHLPEVTRQLAAETKLVPASSLAELVAALPAPAWCR
jgi:6-phosphogluconate dehydrogenase